MRLPSLLALFLAVASLPGLAAATPHDGRGDEATINAHRVDLDQRLNAAEKAGTMPHVEAARHHRALAVMDRSAKADLQRPPHFISAAENATYQRTIAGVETALTKRSR